MKEGVPLMTLHHQYAEWPELSLVRNASQTARADRKATQGSGLIRAGCTVLEVQLIQFWQLLGLPGFVQMCEFCGMMYVEMLCQPVATCHVKGICSFLWIMCDPVFYLQPLINQEG
jgi:hypothetical protein